MTLMTIVALSGGRDSVALLHYLQQQGAVHAAVHVHHGLQDIADEWVTFNTQLCASLGVPLHVEYVHCDLRSGRGVEDEARSQRYQVLLKWARHYNTTISLGHHADDNDETIFYQMLRGTGLKGLRGMQTVTSREGVILERPLLRWRRDEMTAYCMLHQLPWIDDPSNDNAHDYARNYVRQLMPELQKRFPTTQKALERMRTVADDSLHLLNELADMDLQHSHGSVLHVRELAHLSESRQRNAWRRYLEVHFPALRYSDAQLKEWMKRCHKPDPKQWEHDGYLLQFKKGLFHVEESPVLNGPSL